MTDIRFYDFDLNLLRILPAYSGDIGYKSINTQQDLRDSGSLEIVFQDPLLKSIVEDHKANIIVKWRNFQGFLTSYRWTDKECRLTGMHLNGLLKRSLILPIAKRTDTLGNFLSEAISKIAWIDASNIASATESVRYGTEEILTADVFIGDLLAKKDCGYELKADLKNKKFIFEFIKSFSSRLILSKENLNLYDIETTYINKDIVYGGWFYNETEGVWKYSTLDETKSGIYKIDVVLEAKTEADALDELKKHKADYEVTANVKGLTFKKDYNIGDIVRFQADGVVQRKLVKGINRWEENGYGENPIFEEYEEGI